MLKLTFLALGACVALASPGFALEPKKVSDLVTLQPGDSCGTSGVRVNLRRLSSGGVEAGWVVPDGEVLILTAGQVTGSLAQSELGRVDLRIDPGGAIDERLITGSAQNSFDLRYDFGSGVPIRSGAGLCIDTNPAAAVFGAHFHGYLVTDR